MTASWVGVQLQSQRFTGRADLAVRVSTLYRHLMPSVAVPGVLANLDLAPDRGARVYAEMTATREAAAREVAAREVAAREVGEAAGPEGSGADVG